MNNNISSNNEVVNHNDVVLELKEPSSFGKLEALFTKNKEKFQGIALKLTELAEKYPSRQTNNFVEERKKLFEERKKLFEEQKKLFVEQDKLFEEQKKLFVEQDKVFAKQKNPSPKTQTGRLAQQRLQQLLQPQDEGFNR